MILSILFKDDIFISLILFAIGTLDVIILILILGIRYILIALSKLSY